MSDSLTNLMESLESLQHFCMEGICIWVTDTEKFIGQVKGENSPGDFFKVGDPILEGGTAKEAIQKKRVINRYLPPEVYGVEANVIAVPLYNSDKPNSPMGVLGLSKSRKYQAGVLEVSEILMTSVEHLTQASNEISIKADQITSESGYIFNLSGVVNSSINEIKESMKQVRDIAQQTQLLGLNAMIEAARLSTSGKGFNVVAEGIQKLADDAKDLTKDVDKALRDVEKKMELMIVATQKSLDSTASQAAASQEVTASLEEIKSVTETLMDYAKYL